MRKWFSNAPPSCLVIYLYANAFINKILWGSLYKIIKSRIVSVESEVGTFSPASHPTSCSVTTPAPRARFPCGLRAAHRNPGRPAQDLKVDVFVSNLVRVSLIAWACRSVIFPS